MQMENLPGSLSNPGAKHYENTGCQAFVSQNAYGTMMKHKASIHDKESAKKRPLPVLVVALIFITTGIVSIAYHADEYFGPNASSLELIGALSIRVLAFACGILLLMRISWARWLAVLWLAYHVVLSMFHSVGETIAHVVLLALISILLFTPRSIAYFRNADK